MNEVMFQLFVQGPLWDGNLVSKSDRDELVAQGFAARDNGWNFLTKEGVREAVRLSEGTRHWHDTRAYKKGYMLR